VSYTTVEAPSIYSGLNMINSYVSKQLNMSQIKVLVFSEELAREGIEKYINALMREENSTSFLCNSGKRYRKCCREIFEGSGAGT